MDEILPTTEYGTLGENPVSFTVTVDEIPMGILSDDELPLAASGGFSEGDTGTTDEEDGDHNQELKIS